MSRKLFIVNLPVRDLRQSTSFFTRLGFSFDPSFSNDQAGCLVIGDGSYVMLVVAPIFDSFTQKEVVDATKATEAIMAVSVESRQRVDELVEIACAAGAQPANEGNDQGFMYSRGFHDLDGHLWEIFCMQESDR